MGGMPGNIGKGPVFARLEDFTRIGGSPRKRGQLEKARKDLDDPSLDLVFLGQRYDVLAPTAENPEDEHIRELWFGRWWPEHQPLEPVAREGLKRAFDEVLQADAEGSPKPLDAYWLCAGHHLEVVTTVSPQQVTLLVCTPPPPISLYGFEFDAFDPICICKHTSAGYDPRGEERISPPDAKVLVTQLRSGPHQ